jgi:hypothetical protein
MIAAIGWGELKNIACNNSKLYIVVLETTITGHKSVSGAAIASLRFVDVLLLRMIGSVVSLEQGGGAGMLGPLIYRLGPLIDALSALSNLTWADCE